MPFGLAVAVSLPAMAHDRAAQLKHGPTLLTVSARGEVARAPEIAVCPPSAPMAQI